MRIGFLIFSIGFDVVQIVSRCLFFVLTFRVVPLLISTYVFVLVSVCYPGLPATGLARSIFVTRPKIDMVPSCCYCWFSLPSFHNLASNLPCFRLLSSV